MVVMYLMVVMVMMRTGECCSYTKTKGAFFVINVRVIMMVVVVVTVTVRV
jgi:hypothetical protein